MIFIFIFSVFFLLSLSLSRSVYTSLSVVAFRENKLVEKVQQQLGSDPKKPFGTVVPTFSLRKSLLHCLFRTGNIA